MILPIWLGSFELLHVSHLSAWLNQKKKLNPVAVFIPLAKISVGMDPVAYKCG